MLAVKAFQPAPDKVRQVEFHPILPWAVSATKSDHVCVWDWRTKQVVWEAQFGSTDDDLSLDAELARSHLRDTHFAPNPSLLHPVPPSGPKREGAGHVRDVHFLDTDVAQVQLAWHHSMSSGCGTPPPHASAITALKGQRLLIVACDAKVVVVDLSSRRVVELGKGVFEGKSPTAVAFLYHAGSAGPGASARGASGRLLESPLLAVGCADGIVRCVQLFPIKPMVRLVSSHKTPVVAMAVLGVRGQRHEALAVGHQGGSVALYDPLGRATPLAEGLGPRADVKVHDKELLPGSLALVPVAEDPEDTRCLLFSAGGDHKLCGMEPQTLKESLRHKVERAGITCMAHWPRGYVASGVHSLLMGTEAGALLLAHPSSGSVRLACSLEGQIPSGQKRAPKVYGIHVHPTMPNTVAVATNVGTVIMSVVQSASLAATPLPLSAPAQAHYDAAAEALGGAFGGAGGGGATYVTAIGPRVLCVTAATLPSQDASEFPPNQVMGKLEIAGDTAGSRAVVSVSHDGGYVAVAWPGSRQYAVFRQGASAWQQCSRGSGTSVAWHSGRDVLAVLEEETPAVPLGAVVGKPSKDPKKAEKQAEAMRVAAEAAARAAAASAAVRLKALTGTTLSPLPLPLGSAGALDLRGDQPAALAGGPLLAVTLRREVRPPAGELDSSPAGLSAMQLFDWESGARVGPELPEPAAMAWDPSRTMLALAYSGQVLLARAQPDFQVVATLPVCEATSLEWAARQLYMATPTHIYCAIVSPAAATLPGPANGTAASAAPARLITLASLTGAGGVSGSAAQEGFLPPPALRPPGPLALLGPRDGCLWMVGVLGQPMALSLSHPGLRSCSLAASGDLQGAISLAARGLPLEHHDALADLMTSLDGQRGAAAAAALPGITLACELRLRLALRHWQQAVEAAEGLLLGYKRRPHGGWRGGVASAAFAERGYGGGGGGGALGEEFADLSLAGGGAPAMAPAHPEDLDWTQPLRAAASSAKAAAAAAAATRQPGPAAAAATPGAPPAPGSVALVLGLLEELARVGMYDVVGHLARALLVHAVHLSAEQLRAVTAVMAQAGLKTDLPAVAHAVSAGADSPGREAAGLLAALLSGHTALVQESLREQGAVALAAVQAQVYGLSGAAERLAAWQRQLAAAVPLGSAAALGALEVALPASS